MSDADLHEFAMVQLSCLDDYCQQLNWCKPYLSQLMYERTKREQQVTSSERELEERRQRVSSKQQRVAKLQMLKEEAQMRMSMAATLGKLL